MNVDSPIYQYKTRTILILLGLVIFNIAFHFYFIVDGLTYDDFGKPIVYSSREMFPRSAMMFLFTFPLISAFIAFVISIFPYKKMEFYLRLKRAWWLTLLALNGLFSLLLVAMLILKLLGYHPAPFERDRVEAPNKLRRD